MERNNQVEFFFRFSCHPGRCRIDCSVTPAAARNNKIHLPGRSARLYQRSTYTQTGKPFRLKARHDEEGTAGGKNIQIITALAFRVFH